MDFNLNGLIKISWKDYKLVKRREVEFIFDSKILLVCHKEISLSWAADKDHAAAFYPIDVEEAAKNDFTSVWSLL